eukprot:TRINITY_DN21146_c0_g1_i1.p1 TRINITY_DN21146_c0_g1~~TRINITY_DN21146_c0_g1_i1.p1  ORF type:complete len:457 (-),score=119.82 TRINITY_DN21146_c0_g1_i1:108-1478(-)
MCIRDSTHAGSPHYHLNHTDTPARAYKASLNRPHATRGYRAVNMPLNAEYPLIRFLEKQGFDVVYWSGLDTHRFGSKLLDAQYKLFISNSHDEYWSGDQRRWVTAARDTGVHLAFFSGNEMYWKIRWEASPVDGDEHRTMVVYKDSGSTIQLDPVEWTGSWRDGRSINTEGARPENEVTGTIFTVNAWRHDALEVPSQYVGHRFWRNTSVAHTPAGGQAVLLQGLLGHEWDEDIDNGFRPPGLQRLSETTIHNVQLLMDEGSVFDSGTATHHLVMYKHSSGAIVFGAGTCQWSWGLDAHHDSATGVPSERSNGYSIRVGRDQHGPDLSAQQATINLFADMKVLPSTLEPGLLQTSHSTDIEPPACTLNTCVLTEGRLHWRGSARDVHGVVAAVEFSLDETRWHPAHLAATARVSSFEFSLEVLSDAEKKIGKEIFCRAVDDSGNLGASSSQILPIS